jgi:hypothetical protein
MTDQCNRGCALEGFIESLIRKVAEVHMSRSFEFFDNQFKWQVQAEVNGLAAQRFNATST